MAPKSLVLVAAALLLVAAAGQVRGALVTLPGVLPGVVPVNISGIVPCSIGSNIDVTAVQPFANATVQVVCGSTVVATVTTGASGAFSTILGSILSLTTSVVTSLLTGQCKVVVPTPLVACNVSLAGVTETLTAPLQLLNSTTGGVGGLTTTTITILGTAVTIVNGVIILIPVLFSLV